MNRLFIIVLVLPELLWSQMNFTWEKVHENLPFSKDELFDKSAYWIADNYKDSKEVVQLKDEDNGKIVTKGSTSINIEYWVGYVYYYRYSMNFFFKDGRCKVTLDNVYCESAIRMGSQSTYCIPPFEGNPGKINPGPFGNGVSKPKAIELMRELKRELQNVFDRFNTYIISSEVYKSEDDW